MWSRTFLKLAVGCILITVAVGGFLQCRPSRVDSVRNCYERAQNSTVLIVCPSGAQGSGVVVKRGERLFVWTAAHVVDNCDRVVIRSYVRHNGERVGNIDFAGRVLERNDSLDVALLWLIAPASYFDSAEFAGVEPSRVGESVYHVGNYWGADFDDSVSIGVISQIGVQPKYRDWPWQFPLDQTTAFVVYGSSGGGIFRHSDNKLIGIIVGGPAPGKADVNLFVPIRAIYSWATDVSILWAMYGTQSPDDKVLSLAALRAEVRRKSLLPTPPPPDEMQPIAIPE